MATTIKLKNGSGAPAASDLVQGEPAFDLTNKRLYTEDSSGAVIEVGSNPSSLSINGTAVTATAAEINVLDGITSSTAELNILDGVTATTAELNYVDGVTSNIQTQLDTKGTGTVSSLSDLSVTASATELNLLDGVTATTAEINYLDGVTSNIQTQLDAAGGTVTLGDLGVTATAAELNTLDGITATTAELNILDGVTSTAAELNILDGVTATATEINVLDGDTAATSTTLADADRVVVNDAGTMKQVALTDFETYFETSLDTLSNVTTVGALNSGSITSGFGAIDTGSSNITTTGTVSFGSLTDGAITITAFVDEDNMASDSATLVPTQQSVKAYVDTQIGGLSSSLSGLSDTNITTPADGALLFYDTGTSTWIDNVVSGDITIADTGVAAISSGVIVNDDINASAAISVSKTALVDGTGLTLTGDTLSVDASQTQITAVGTIATGTWQGTAIADAYVANNLTISGGTVDNSVIGGTTAAAGTFTDLTASGTLTLGGTAITSTAAEINILDGVTATTAELNYVDGVTSNIQTQLDVKASTGKAIAMAIVFG
jgi:predicted translin family RNA/ssDNA-binding protein